MALVNITTREHYEKYAKLSEGISTSRAPRYNDPNLAELYAADNVLNNIPLRAFDAQYPVRGGISLAENTCILKHILIFRVLKAVPELYETYDECRQARKAIEQ